MSAAMIMLFAVGFIGAITPGPDMLLVARNTILFGAKRALIVLGGIAFGWIFYLGIIYFGLTHLLSNAYSQIALGVLGGLYLGYIGINILRTRYDENRDESSADSALATLSAKHDETKSRPDSKKSDSKPDTFLRGLVVNLSNPKAILFFGVVVTQFIGKDLALSIAVLFASLVSAFVCVVVVSSYFRKHITYKVFFCIDRLSAVLFLGFALSLFYHAFCVYANITH